MAVQGKENTKVKSSSHMTDHMTRWYDVIIESEATRVMRMLTFAMSTNVLALSLSFLWSIFTFRKL